MREFADEQVAVEGQARLRARHGDYFAALALAGGDADYADSWGAGCGLTCDEAVAAALLDEKAR